MVAGSSQSFGDLLRRQRLAAGLTQEELADLAGLSVRGLSDLERGARRAPRRETLLLLAEALHLSEEQRARLEAAARQREVPAARTAGGSSSANSVPALPLVGRTQELALLDQVLTDGPPVLMIAGEPGIGKSRLLQAGIEQAEARGWTMLSGSCHRRSGQDPYAPLLGSLADSLRRQSPAEQRLHVQGCTWLVRLLPELAETGVISPPTWTLPPEQERRLMFAAVAQYLANVAGPAGTLLVLDDLHWVGPDALDLLQALLHAPADRPLRLLAAYRDTDVADHHPLTLLVADLAREGRANRVVLSPLAETEAAALLAQLLPETTEKATDEDTHVRQQVLSRAGGVPLFLVSCVQALFTGHLTWNGVSHVPWTLREAILQRVVALQETAQQILRLAAVVGRRVPRALLVAVAARASLAEEVVLDALEGCGRARLLGEVGGDAYQFTHDLIREVLLTDLGTARRALLHRRVAEVLEATVPAPAVTVLAYHYAQSDEREKAILYLERAGDSARARYAQAEAAEAYREVVARLDTKVQVVEAARVREKLGEELTLLAHYDQALEVLEAAAASYRLAGDREGELRTLAQLGGVHRWRGTAQEGLKQLLPLAETLKMEEPSQGAARLFVALTQLYMGAGLYHEQLAMAEQAANMARSLGDNRLFTVAQGRRGSAYLALGRLEEARQVLVEVLPLAETAGEGQTWRHAIINLGSIATYRGNFVQARTYMERALLHTNHVGDRAELVFLTFQRGLIAFHLGDWSQARSDFQQAANLTPMGVLSTYSLGGLGLLSLAEGDEAAASRSFTEALALAEQYHDLRALRWLQGILVEQDLLAGQPEQARARLAPLLDLANPGVSDVDAGELLPLLVWTHIESGNIPQAQELITTLLVETRTAQLHLVLVGTLRMQGLLATRQGRWREAETALEEALELARSFPYPYEEAKILLEHARLHMQQEAWEQAQQRLEVALTVLGRLGERLYARHIENLLSQCKERRKEIKHDSGE